MAEKTGELSSIEKSDQISARAETRLEEYPDPYSGGFSETEGGELEVNTGGAPAETEQIKARIEATRNQMGETIDAIQERLSLANISEQVSETVNSAIETAKDTAYDATIGKAVNFMKNIGDGVTHSNAFRTVRNNPLPLALIGIGAGLLAYQAFAGRQGNGREMAFDRRSGRSRRGNGGDLERGEGASFSGEGAFGNTTERGYTEGVTATSGNPLESVKHVAGNAYEGVAGAISNVYSGAGEITHRAYERAGEFGTLAHEKYDHYVEENPLAVGAVALAMGAAVGFALPSTRYEGKLMGEARENLMQRAQEAAGSLAEKAKQVANEAGETIKQEAQALTE